MGAAPPGGQEGHRGGGVHAPGRALAAGGREGGGRWAVFVFVFCACVSDQGFFISAYTTHTTQAQLPTYSSPPTTITIPTLTDPPRPRGRVRRLPRPLRALLPPPFFLIIRRQRGDKGGGAAARARAPPPPPPPLHHARASHTGGGDGCAKGGGGRRRRAAGGGRPGGVGRDGHHPVPGAARAVRFLRWWFVVMGE